MTNGSEDRDKSPLASGRGSVIVEASGYIEAPSSIIEAHIMPKRRYKIVTDRSPARVDAPVFRAFWQRQRHTHRPSREFMRLLAHDYWIAKTAPA